MRTPDPSSHMSQPKVVAIDAELAFLSIARAIKGKFLRRQQNGKLSSCLDLACADPAIPSPDFDQIDEMLAHRSVARQLQRASNELRPPKICSPFEEPSLDLVEPAVPFGPEEA